MIHLVAIQTSPGVWTITTSDMVDVDNYFATLRPERQVKILQEWVDIILKKESGSEDQPHWTVIYDKEPE